MATILLQNIGAGLGAALGGSFGAAAGRAVGGMLGSTIDQSIFGKDRVINGPRLDEARILSAEEGASVPRVYGRHKVAGHIVWATRFEERRASQQTGGKGSGPKVTTNSYSYYANFAVGICHGPVSCLRRVWADGEELDLTRIEYRFYEGTEEQLPDPLIEAKQGANNAPAYRGLCYIVFEGLPLEDYGNRIPQLSFEIVNSIGELEKQIKSITLIPGSTEHGLDTVARSSGGGGSAFSTHNKNTTIAATDWQASLDELQAVCPNLQQVALVVTWFGDDLRADHCKLYPGVTSLKTPDWQVAGYAPSSEIVVSEVDGSPAYGGTPSDQSVLNAIADLKSRGLKVMLYPFLMMDVPQDNTLPGLNGEERQPSYPWRGEISCYPAPGSADSVDKTSAARSQLTGFRVNYERFIRHYLELASEAGGVDGFLLGSELRGLTRVRDHNGEFPFVEALTALARETKQLLGASTFVTYGADWSEYFGYHPQDGSGDVLFNLDPLWASQDIDAVGIDNYMPVSDLRNGFEPAGDQFLKHNLDYFSANIASGEGWDWYYSNGEDRNEGVRTPITDGLGEPWIFRYKDLHSWWANHHHERIDGQRSATATEWQPGAKPIVFTELGCPAVDHGANQPNVFVDAKSSQSALPYFSSGTRDDLIQRRFLEAHFKHWGSETWNPRSSQYDGHMVDVSQIFPWAWDARPFPWFPRETTIWSDGENWKHGHWLNGRLGGCSVQDLANRILADFGIGQVEVKLDGMIDGYVLSGPVSARGALEPLLDLFAANLREEEGQLVIDQSSYNDQAVITKDEVVQEQSRPILVSNRTTQAELPAEAVLFHCSVEGDYEETGTKSRRLDSSSNRQISMSVPACLPSGMAIGLADMKLREAWNRSEVIELGLSTKGLAVSLGDIVEIPEYVDGKWQVVEIEHGVHQRLTLEKNDPSLSPLYQEHPTATAINAGKSYGAPLVLLLDLPAIRDQDVGKNIYYFAATAEPWAGQYAAYASPVDHGFKLRDVFSTRATLGVLGNNHDARAHRPP